MVSIRQKTSVKLRANAQSPSHSLSYVTVRDVAFEIDEPTERGGTNLGPAPTETALAALIGCTNTIGHKCANKLGVDIGHLTISAVCDFDRRGVMLEDEIDIPFTHIDLMVEADGPAGDAELQRVAAEVMKYCPLSKLFRQAGTTITEEWKKKTT